MHIQMYKTSSKKGLQWVKSGSVYLVGSSIEPPGLHSIVQNTSSVFAIRKQAQAPE